MSKFKILLLSLIALFNVAALDPDERLLHQGSSLQSFANRLAERGLTDSGRSYLSRLDLQGESPIHTQIFRLVLNDEVAFEIREAAAASLFRSKVDTLQYYDWVLTNLPALPVSIQREFVGVIRSWVTEAWYNPYSGMMSADTQERLYLVLRHLQNTESVDLIKVYLESLTTERLAAYHASPTLREFLNHADVDVRMQAARALYRGAFPFQEEQEVERRRADLAIQESAEVRLELLRVFASFRTPKVLELLEDLSQHDPDARVRAEAAKLLEDQRQANARFPRLRSFGRRVQILCADLVG